MKVTKDYLRQLIRESINDLREEEDEFTDAEGLDTGDELDFHTGGIDGIVRELEKVERVSNMGNFGIMVTYIGKVQRQDSEKIVRMRLTNLIRKNKSERESDSSGGGTYITPKAVRDQLVQAAGK